MQYVFNTQHFLRSVGISYYACRVSILDDVFHNEAATFVKMLPSPAPRNFLNNFRESLGKPNTRYG